MAWKIDLKEVGGWDAFPEYDVLYCDLPWGEGIMKLFQRMAQQAGVAVPSQTHAGALASLFGKADKRRPIFVEYSATKAAATVEAAAAKAGHRHFKTVPATQSNGKPYCLLCFNVEWSPPAGLHGFELAAAVGAHYRGKWVFDPFAGMGLTAEAMLRAGANYHGSEPNAARFKHLAKRVKAFA